MKTYQNSPFTSSTYLFVKRALTTLLMWQMIFTPTVFASDISGDANLQAQKDACTGPSKEWNSSLNSCTTKAEAEQTKADSEACSQSDNPDECYLSHAEGLSGVLHATNYKDSSVEMVSLMVSGAYAIFGAFAGAAAIDKTTGGKVTKKLTDDKVTNKSCKSSKIFQWTSLAWVAGDLYLKFSAKKGFEKIAENYKKEEANDQLKGSKEGSYQAQVRAFEYLKKEQEDVKKQADKRKLLQMAVIVGYIAALGYGIAELVPTSTLPKCVKPDPKKAKAVQATDVQRGSIFYKTGNLIGTSLGNTIASGIMLGLNGYLIYHAMSERSKAEENIASIDKVLSTYNDYMSGFCPDGREDATKPDCYCYNSDGTQNPNRTKSVICQNLFAERGKNYADQKVKAATTGPRQGCVTVTGQFDLNCKCAKMKNTQTGQNACAHVSSISTNNAGFASALSLPDAIKTANGLTNGASTALANMNGASVAAKAARGMRNLNSMLSNGKSKGVNVPTRAILERSIANDLKASAPNMKGLPNLSQATGTGASTLPKGVQKALAKAQKDKKSSAAVGALLSSLSNGTGKIDFGKSKATTFVWNDSAAGPGSNVQTFMDKKYKYKNADIVNRKDVSLWNVISRRYQTSGIKRLFEDDSDE